MNNWKLMSLLSRMDAKGKKEFERWYAYEQKGRKTHPWNLFQLVKKEGKEYASYEAMGKALEKRSGATASKIRDYSSNLCKQIELFLSIEALRKDEYQQKIYLLNHYQKTNNTKAFERTCTQEKEKLKNKAALDADDYEKLLELEELAYNQSPSAEGLQEVNELFDLEWTLRKLEMACANFSYRNIFGVQTQSFILDEIIRELPQWDKWEKSFWHQIYLNIYTLFTSPEKIDIQKILAQMADNSESKAQTSMKNAYTLLLNYQIGINNKLTSYESGRDLLVIYLWGLKKGIIFENTHLYWVHYKNLVTLPLKEGKKELAHKNLESLQKFLRPHEKEEAYRYCQGVYEYYDGNLQRALRLWAEKKFMKLFYEIHSRFLGWQIMYEQEKNRHTNPLEEKILLSAVSKLETYIHRLPNISETKKQSFLNRIKMYYSLFKVSTIVEMSHLVQTIQNTDHLTNKKWLLDMIELRKQALL